MEPITTTALATSVVTYLATKLKENKTLNSFFDDFTEATVNWIRPIFLKEDGSEEKIIQKLKENPDSDVKQEAVKVAIISEIEDNPAAEQWLLEMAKIIAEKTGNTITKTNTMTVTGNNTNNFQDISGSNINIK